MRNLVRLTIGLVITLAFAPPAGADDVPQTPDQIAFNSHVRPGSILVVAKGPNGNGTVSSFCMSIPSLKRKWAQKMSGQDESADSECASLWTGSKVKILLKTNAYAIDDPSLPASPYGNDAHLIVDVVVLSVTVGHGENVAQLVGKAGYMLVDDLVWQASK
jgi:hypothetical protein